MKNSITFDDLPKYLTYNRGNKTSYFHLSIIKWERDGHYNAYYAMYAKFNPRSHTLNLSKVLFGVSGTNIEDTQIAFLQKFAEMRKCIVERTWKGLPPEKLDLKDMKSFAYE